MRNKSFWLSYDLGLKGDYHNLYIWLDNLGALECGDSVAYFKFKSQDDFLKEIENSLSETVDIRKSDRLYLVYLDHNDSNKMKGKFLFGHRKRAPWEGFSNKDGNTQVDSE